MIVLQEIIDADGSGTLQITELVRQLLGGSSFSAKDLKPYEASSSWEVI